MFDFIPLELYYPIYINLSLGIVLFTVLHAYLLPIENPKNIIFINCIGYLYLVFTTLFIGTRPVSGQYFVDMVTYNLYFESYANGQEVTTSKDTFFHYFMKFCSNFMNARLFFLTCATLYIFPLYRISKVFFKEYWYYSFLLFAVSFSFWSYGTNGIRNGIATSLFLLAVSYYKNNIFLVVFLILASLVHQTMLLPVMAFILTFFHSEPRTYLIAWFIAIPLSIFFGGMWEQLFASMSFGDERLEAYLVGENETDRFSSTGFRYDFLIYSASAVYAGWYFIFKKNFSDKMFLRLFNTYLICNAFWVLVIRANFSNRFAYLSWFMMSLIIVYPFLKQKFFNNHYIMLGKVIIAYFSFTYLMYYVYYGK